MRNSTGGCACKVTIGEVIVRISGVINLHILHNRFVSATAVSVLVMVVMGSGAPRPCLAEFLTTGPYDLLSTFSWATLDFPVTPEPLVSLEGLNLTTTNLNQLKAANLKPRKKRTINLQNRRAASIDVSS